MLTRPTPDLPAAPDCAAVQSQVFAACDGELTREQVAILDRHLADCAPCRARYAADATFLHVLRRAVSVDTAPAELRDRILLSLTTRATVNAPA